MITDNLFLKNIQSKLIIIIHSIALIYVEQLLFCNTVFRYFKKIKIPMFYLENENKI